MGNYEDLKTGWLSPAGDFFPCFSYDHNEEAREILKTLGRDYPHHPDDELMEAGWVYIGISSFLVHEWRIGWNKFLTEYQINFLKPYFESDLSVPDYTKWRWKREVEKETDDAGQENY